MRTQRKPRKHYSPRLFSLEDRTVPSTFTVTTNAGSAVSGSLPTAILAANANAGPDTIIFNSFFDTPQTIVLTVGQLPITGSLTITGPGAGVTINGNNNGRVFNIDGTGNLVVGLSDLTITGGKVTGTEQGGGIRIADETVTLTRCTVRNNTTASAGGGVTCLAGSLTVLDSTFSGNSAPSGGALHFNGPPLAGGFIVRNSTISGNSATSNIGGGILLDLGFSGTCKIQNSTITANSAKSNGGGLSRSQFSSGVFNIESSIVSGNLSGDISNGGLVTVNFSAIGDSSGFTLSGANNLAFGTNLKLGSLANNGGPTLTHLPAIDSPLMDKGSNPTGLTFDQRGIGYPRLLNAVADIGAIDVIGLLIVKNTNDSGMDSLRQAIFDANAVSGANTITFDAAAFATPQTIVLTTGELGIGSNAIHGPGASLLNVTSNGNSRIFSTGSGFISGLTISGGKAINGAGILVGGNFTLSQCVVTGNSAALLGGGIYSTATVNVIGSVISNNTALVGGGMWLTEPGNANTATEIVSSSITGNTAWVGGGIRAKAMNVSARDSTIANNQAIDGAGGGIYFFGEGLNDRLVLRNCTISGNSATGDGGGIAILNAPSYVHMIGSTIAGNVSISGKGGGVHSNGTNAIFSKSSVVSNNSNLSAPDIFAPQAISVNNSAIGSSAGFTLSGANNLPFGIDLKLGPLANNGGPTLTHLPAADSPLIDNGSNSYASVPYDQRGVEFPRVIGSQADIGAVEVLNLVVRNTNDSGLGSLRQTILHAETHPGDDTITFDPTVFASMQTITLTSGEILISDVLTITGPAGGVSVSGNLAGRIFKIQFPAGPGGLIEMSDLTLTKGRINLGMVGSGGSAIRQMNGELHLNRVTITENYVIGALNEIGGAISVNPAANLIISDSVLSNNGDDPSQPSPGPSYGGALNVLQNGIVTIARTTISGNSAGMNGGGIFINQSAILTVTDSTIAGNKAGIYGGGIYLSIGSKVNIFNSTISSNSAITGGGIGSNFVNPSGFTTIRNSTIAFNTATTVGGIYSGSTITFCESVIVTDNVGTLAEPNFGGNIGFQNSITEGSAMLAPLANNGGPTLTHTLLPGSPAMNAGSNPAMLTTDQRGLPRSVGVTDIGSVEVQILGATVTGFTVNNGNPQRSRLTTISVAISASLDASIFQNPGAVTLTRTAATSTGTVGTVVTIGSGLQVSPGAGNANTITLTFTNAVIGGVQYGSLADGRWQLAIPSLGYQSTLNDPNLRRLYGDGNADGTVDGNDLGAFGAAFGSSGVSAFDFNNDLTVDALDFGEFGARFGVTL